ncbi:MULTISPECIES: ParB/RepB/Spo0J family partition protein [Cysteiniphilum]|uniref:ParB/RepB/Spo0J family partition protein n=1 Tax=Cysteiniphilum TaxID=2056696 RepID=UPI0017825F75|nr:MULTISPECIES: ParB/RepB/Spo0J family partition protein [Cysteiniphilum]
MEVIEINPSQCKRWEFADRSAFEFGDIHALGMDIKKNGQVEPVMVRPLKNDAQYQYEVIAGSRRWKACLELDIDLRAIVKDISDEQAYFLQLRENEKQPISDYSRGIHFQKLLDSNKTTVAEIASYLHCSKEKVYDLLSFNKVPQQIWDAVINMGKVSCRSSKVIALLARKGDEYIAALIEIAEDIRKGAGCKKIEKLVNEIVHGEQDIDDHKEIITDHGQVIGKWVKNTIVFDQSFTFSQDQIEQALKKLIN